MAKANDIRPGIVRDSLYFFIGDVGFSSQKTAICAASAVEAHRLDLFDTLQVQRIDALADMRASIGNVAAFAVASKEEAALAGQVRRLRRHRNGRDIPLTPEDLAIFHRASERQEREYRIADRTDAEVLRLRLQFGGVACIVAKGIRS
jgi:hypothetical protein